MHSAVSYHNSKEEQWKRIDLLEFIRIPMRLAATLPWSNGNQTFLIKYFLKFFDLFYEILTNFALGHMIVLFTCSLWVNYETTNLEYKANCIFQIFSYLWVLVAKLYLRRIRFNLLNDINATINDNYETRSAPGLTYVTMERVVYYVNKWAKALFYSLNIVVVCSLIYPMFYKEKTLPFDCWYPFDYKQPIVYELAYFLQAMCQIQASCGLTSTSGYHMVLCILLSGQFDILCCSAKNLIATTYIKMGANIMELRKLKEEQSASDTEVNQYSYAVEVSTPLEELTNNQCPSDARDFQSCFRESFINCLQHHRYIISTLNKIEKFFYIPWFIKICTSSFIICMLAFAWTKTLSESTFAHKVVMAQYMVAALCEFFIICYFADMVCQNSERCGDALWRSPWHLHIEQVHFEYKFFILMGQKRFTLTAGKIFSLDLNRFRSIITSTFSALTVLNKLDARD